MPRGKSKSKRKFTRDELEDRLEEEFPGSTQWISSAPGFTFFTDRTKQENVYVKVGESELDNAEVENTKVEKTKEQYTLVPVYVGLGDMTGNRMISFNVRALHPEKIIHENKEFARIGTIYSPPFVRLAPIRYEYPSSSFAESLQWARELRALTMFAFVWSGCREEFFDFDKGEGLEILFEVLKRDPKATNVAAKRNSHGSDQKSVGANASGASVEIEPSPDVFANEYTEPEPELVTGKDKEMNTESGTDGEGNVRVKFPMLATALVQKDRPDARVFEGLAYKKRTHEEYVAGQKY